MGDMNLLDLLLVREEKEIPSWVPPSWVIEEIKKRNERKGDLGLTLELPVQMPYWPERGEYEEERGRVVIIDLNNPQGSLQMYSSQ